MTDRYHKYLLAFTQAWRWHPEQVRALDRVEFDGYCRLLDEMEREARKRG